MTKIDIFSGFLGAGKTTLIKKLIAEAYTGEKIVLIENEFGEIAIDGGFLKDSGVQINEMNSGCICCSLVGDFADALKKVLEQFHPDRILIEPSGVGKLSDVIRAVQGVQSDELVLNGFTTVVDANKCKMYMKNFGEFFNNQVENASAIILSRTEGIRPEKLDAAVALLREKNPTATIVTTPWTELDGKQILETMERRDTLSAELEHLKAEAAEFARRALLHVLELLVVKEGAVRIEPFDHALDGVFHELRVRNLIDVEVLDRAVDVGKKLDVLKRQLGRLVAVGGNGLQAGRQHDAGAQTGDGKR